MAKASRKMFPRVGRQRARVKMGLSPSWGAAPWAAREVRGAGCYHCLPHEASTHQRSLGRVLPHRPQRDRRHHGVRKEQRTRVRGVSPQKTPINHSVLQHTSPDVCLYCCAAFVGLEGKIPPKPPSSCCPLCC